MLICPQCNSEVKLTWTKYFRTGWKYQIYSDSCDTPLKIHLPNVLAWAERVFAAAGTLIIGIIILTGTIDNSLIKFSVLIVSAIPWLFFNFYINILLDGRYGHLRKGADKND